MSTPNNMNNGAKPATPAPSYVQKEAAAAETVVAPAEVQKEQISPDRLAMVRREKAIRERERQIQVQEQKFKDLEAKYKTDYVPKSKIKEDPLSLFQDGLITYDQLHESIVNSGAKADPAVMQLQRQNRDLQDKIDQLSKQFESNQTHTVEETKRQVGFGVQQFLKTADSYELVKGLGDDVASTAISELMLAEYEKGNFISEAEAAQQIEDHLAEEFKPFLKSKKIREMLAALDAQTTSGQDAPVAEGADLDDAIEAKVAADLLRSKQGNVAKPAQTLRTLTQTASATAPHKLSPQERKERAILAFQGKLK